MDIYVLRHGRAGERGPAFPDDSERPLTDDGRARVEEVAKGLLALDVRYDRILTSPFARARETAEIVARIHGTDGALEVLEELSQGGGPERVLRALRRDHAEAEALLLVGHEPDLGQLVARLLTGANDGVAVTLKKGGLAKVSMPSLAPRARGTLEWLLTPKQLRGLR